VSFSLMGSLFVFWKPLSGLIPFSFTHDYGSHIILIAPASAYIIYVNRREIFSKLQSSLLAGSLLFTAGAEAKVARQMLGEGVK
jgi:hypothetical protein